MHCISLCLGLYTDHFIVHVSLFLDKEPSECQEQNYDNFDDDEEEEDYKRPLRAPKNRENVFGEIPGIVNRVGKWESIVIIIPEHNSVSH